MAGRSHLSRTAPKSLRVAHSTHSKAPLDQKHSLLTSLLDFCLSSPLLIIILFKHVTYLTDSVQRLLPSLHPHAPSAPGGLLQELHTPSHLALHQYRSPVLTKPPIRRVGHCAWVNNKDTVHNIYILGVMDDNPDLLGSRDRKVT
ncbi:hypothetical protein DTO021D3_1346 [Paecilomyces variotii]|nr:hypothetical protein DTO032I3_2312 [Paecilomyces variotii]KAJ9282050.1 hypothetical protein DTO021D3_1346 [Paecilomyces variotii]KAJ9342053.1 hypothetical protein DTO027B6_5500 [Paecilomyces variotii]KAJ9388476.1 hypothetical protein DTO032I4_2446 [Paecilomyces variotii]